MEKKESLTNYQIQELYVLINEIKNEQQNLSVDLQKKFAVLMNKLMKMQDYHKIEDMTNQVFEMRLSNIEDLLFKLTSNKVN